MIRAPRDNAIKYLGSWIASVAAVWVVLMSYGKENPWVDRFIIGEIAVCAAVACWFIVRDSPRYTARIIGVLSMFSGIVVLYVGSQVLAAGYWGDPTPDCPPELLAQLDYPAMLPYWWRSLGRSLLAVAGPLLLWGYYHWYTEEAPTTR